MAAGSGSNRVRDLTPASAIFFAVKFQHITAGARTLQRTDLDT